LKTYVIPSGVEESLIACAERKQTVRDVSTHSTSLRARLSLDMTTGKAFPQSYWSPIQHPVSGQWSVVSGPLAAPATQSLPQAAYLYLAPEGAAFIASLGRRPRKHGIEGTSAESAIHLWNELFGIKKASTLLKRAFSAWFMDVVIGSWGAAPGYNMRRRLWR
jgi:hypothetical protein